MNATQHFSTGHTVLAAPVPTFEGIVRRRTAFYDPSFVAADPDFVHAHITVLGPWVPEPTAEDLEAVAEIAAGTTCFDINLERVEEFPSGLLHLPPKPADELRALTAQLAAAFPEHPPYGGVFGDVAPHLTLDQRSATVTREVVQERVVHLLPAVVTVDRIDLQWWANDDCRLLQSFPLRHRASDE